MVNYDPSNADHREALAKTAKFYEENAQGIFDEDAYADHVTYVEKVEKYMEGLQFSVEVSNGEHMNCFAVLQRFNTNLTGKCEPLLPMY